MIDCSNEIIFKEKKRKKKRRKIVTLFLVFLLITNVYTAFVITPFCVDFSLDYANNLLTTSINESVLNSFAFNVEYADLVTIEKNASGDVSIMTVNSVNVNKLSREISILVEDKLGEKLEKGTPIPLGAFSGIPLLAGYGKKIYVKSVSVSYVDSDFSSTFESVGINHTMHSIYSIISCTVKIDYPFYHNESVCSSRILISECVLVGEIPEIYLNGRLFGI